MHPRVHIFETYDVILHQISGRKSHKVKNCNDSIQCPGRRDFIVKAIFGAGGLILTLTGLSSITGANSRLDGDEDITFQIGANDPLSKVGGWQVFDSKVGKVIILRTGEASFVAFSARCTHKGGLIEYDEGEHNFLCPKHGSRFDKVNGNVVTGPADEPLPAYAAKGNAASVTISIKTKAL